MRNVLLATADLVAGLESSLSNVQGIANKLRDHVFRIDQYMTSAAMDHQRRAHVYHSALPPAAWGPNAPPPPLQHNHHMPPQMPNSNMRTESPQNMSVASSVSPESATPGWNNTPPSFGDPKHMGYAPMAPDMFEFNFPAMAHDTQVQLPNDLLIDLPFEFGAEGFDFLMGL